MLELRYRGSPLSCYRRSYIQTLAYTHSRCFALLFHRIARRSCAFDAPLTHRGLPTLYEAVEQPLKLVQTAAVLEILHALTRIVSASPVTTTIQVFSRLFVLWAVVHLAPTSQTVSPVLANSGDTYICSSDSCQDKERRDTQYQSTTEKHSVQRLFDDCFEISLVSAVSHLQVFVRAQSSFFGLMVSSWALVEVPRYLFLALDRMGACPGFLKWLRYSLFAVLYPTGITGEVGCILSSLAYIKRHDIFRVAMPNSVNAVFDYPTVLMAIVGILYPYGSYVMYGHMLRQRRRKLASPTYADVVKKNQ